MKVPSRKGKTNKFKDVQGLTDIYDMYISDKELNSPYYVDRSLFRKILFEYLDNLNIEILEGHIIFMPHGLGSIYVVKKKVVPGRMRLSPNWELSRKYDKMIYHLNEHSNGYRFNFKWDKLPCRFRNHKMYRLSMVRGMKRTSANYIKNLGYNYIEE